MKDGRVVPPVTAEEAADLLEKVATARDDYNFHKDDHDLMMSVQMLRSAAQIIRTGEIWHWIPVWREKDFE